MSFVPPDYRCPNTKENRIHIYKWSGCVLSSSMTGFLTNGHCYVYAGSLYRVKMDQHAKLVFTVYAMLLTFGSFVFAH